MSKYLRHSGDRREPDRRHHEREPLDLAAWERANPGDLARLNLSPIFDENRRRSGGVAMADDKAKALITKLDADVAKAAFGAALDLNTKQRTERIVKAMSAEIDRGRQLAEQLRIVNLMIDLNARRLAALEAGQFKINARGANDSIIYNDPELNKEAIDHGDGRVTQL